jgi:adenine deaminase
VPRFCDSYRYENLSDLTQAARKQAPADLVITNAQVIDVLTETIYPGEVWIKSGVIVHVERHEPGGYDAKQVIDARGGYVAPGLMDSHVHVESSMLSPYHFGRGVVRHGTTAVFTGPHEIVNVAGQAGFRYMLENSQHGSLIRQFLMIPSCVPAVPQLESAGAVIVADDIDALAALDRERVIGLAEVMDFIGVINGDLRMQGILNAARRNGLYMQSHCPGLSGNDLSAYLAAGLGGNHEVYDADALVSYLQAGGWVDISGSSSIANRLEMLLPAFGEFTNPGTLKITLCTDDVHAADIIDVGHGHINKVVAKLIAAGIPAPMAFSFATRNTASEFGIDNLGAVRPGNLADLIVFDDLSTIEPSWVIVGGEVHVSEGRLTQVADAQLVYPSDDLKAAVGQTMRLSKVTPDRLVPTCPDAGAASVAVNAIVTSDLYTQLDQVEVAVTDGRLDISARDDLCYIAILDRYGLETISIGILQGYGLGEGAVATTISHDSHNMTLIYRDPALAAELANQVRDAGGGIAAIDGHGVSCLVDLPIGGLMSYLSGEDLSIRLGELSDKLASMFGRPISILMMTIFALPVIPDFRITNKGIVNGLTQEFIPLFA